MTKAKSYEGKTISNSTDLAMFLLEEGHVATVGGDAFGDPDCFRMSYATSDDNIREAMEKAGQNDLVFVGGSSYVVADLLALNDF